MYQILSQSVRFCRLYIKKKHCGVFSVHSAEYSKSLCGTFCPGIMLGCNGDCFLSLVCIVDLMCDSIH